ncbi:MAG: hypothetical protein U0U70_09470 [Chitinophagaceae bacterium]
MIEKITPHTAEAFLFSGRPNPRWKLNKAQQRTWRQYWEEAPRGERQANRLPVLGYSGCLLQYDEHSYWIIFNGCVSFYEKDKVTNKKDINQQMEQWLLGTAPGEVQKLTANL